MKRLFAAILVLMLSLSLAALASGAEQEVPKTVGIEYKENPTTGYEWTLKFDPEGIAQLQSDEYIPDDASGELAGAGGRHEWIIEGLKSGTTKLSFTYSQPWDTETEPYVTIVYTLSVDEDLFVTVEGVEGDEKDMVTESVEELLGEPQGL